MDADGWWASLISSPNNECCWGLEKRWSGRLQSSGVLDKVSASAFEQLCNACWQCGVESERDSGPPPDGATLTSGGAATGDLADIPAEVSGRWTGRETEAGGGGGLEVPGGVITGILLSQKTPLSVKKRSWLATSLSKARISASDVFSMGMATVWTPRFWDGCRLGVILRSVSQNTAQRSLPGHNPSKVAQLDTFSMVFCLAPCI